MDYAKNDHLVMFCNGHGDILRKPFSVKNTPEGIAYFDDQVIRSCRRLGIKKNLCQANLPINPIRQLKKVAQLVYMKNIFYL